MYDMFPSSVPSDFLFVILTVLPEASYSYSVLLPARSVVLPVREVRPSTL